jgi:predicted RNase H-like HicB family nuclease
MLSEYLRAAMRHAKYELLSEDGSFFGEIPDFQGVYANQATLESCREQLQEVLEDWVLFRVSRNLELPVVDGLRIEIKKVA